MRIANKEASFFDFKLFFTLLTLLLTGLAAIYSVSFETGGLNNFKRQIIFAVIALGVFWVCSRINYGTWENYAEVIYLIGLTLMTLVLFLGERKHGAEGWFGIATFTLQPVEFMKIGVILIGAKYLSRLRMDDRRPRHIMVTGIYVLLPILLALRQPDFGSAAVLAAIWALMILMRGIKKRHAVTLAVLTLVGFAVGWFWLLQPFQKARIISFINPENDPSGSGYHVLQSMTAIGSGGIYGKGLGYGSQSQLHFLPEAHTDFIYGVIAEELGLVGVIILMGGFFILFLRIYKIAQKSVDNFGRFIIVGVMAFLFIQLLVNAGMNIGMVPVTGLPLPFVSYGGSALVTELFLLGMVFNIYSVSSKSEGYR